VQLGEIRPLFFHVTDCRLERELCCRIGELKDFATKVIPFFEGNKKNWVKV
jgi:hypothetical protein